ncbi:hypothetical protein PFISCL1PPCAC_15637, partial [Pristionchus fissidentatus]
RMGVAWVLEISETSSAAQIERDLLVAGAELTGGYDVDCIQYKPNESGISPFNLLHHSQFPQSAFSIAHQDGDKSYKASPRASHDRGFDLILHKLNVGLQADSAGKFEVSGNELKLQDFRIRIGMATQNTYAKGVIVEVEYGPSSVVTQAIPALTEFIEYFFPEHSQEKPEVLKKSTPEPYTALETLYQYSLLFSHMRKRTS